MEHESATQTVSSMRRLIEGLIALATGGVLFVLGTLMEAGWVVLVGLLVALGAIGWLMRMALARYEQKPSPADVSSREEPTMNPVTMWRRQGTVGRWLTFVIPLGLVALALAGVVTWAPIAFWAAGYALAIAVTALAMASRRLRRHQV